MTDEVTVLVRKPETICEHCVEHSRHENEDVGIVWCEHSRYGGIYTVDAGMWNIIGPFDVEEDFKRYVMAVFSRQVRQKAHKK